MSASKLLGRQSRMRKTTTSTWSLSQQLGLIQRDKNDTPALRRKCEEFSLRQGKQDTDMKGDPIRPNKDLDYVNCIITGVSCVRLFLFIFFIYSSPSNRAIPRSSMHFCYS